SYDRRRLLRFVSDVKAGVAHVEAPVYSHLTYDIVEDERVVVERPDVLILEGLNVLQPARPRRDGRVGMAVSDFFDFSVYVDARGEDVQRWYVERFLKLRRTAFSDPRSYFRRYAELSDGEARETALRIWRTINGPNLRENVVPTRGRADLVLRKDGQHRVQNVLRRKGGGTAAPRGGGTVAQRPTRSRTTPASRSAISVAWSSCGASTITRTTGSVPEGRSSTLPVSPSSRSAAAMASVTPR